MTSAETIRVYLEGLGWWLHWTDVDSEGTLTKVMGNEKYLIFLWQNHLDIKSKGDSWEWGRETKPHSTHSYADPELFDIIDSCS